MRNGEIQSPNIGKVGSIEITQLGKAYKVYPSRFARLKEWLLPFSEPQSTLKWILQDINIIVTPGEAIGLIGINGAGKSTLLKMITGTIQPTIGSVRVTGRVAALLELGMGFHPDFTGRQNVYMAAQLQGYDVTDIDQFMPEIEEFAEIGDYIDQPIRTYSSGMQVRLAFSVATAIRPDILIVDEALAVGDSYFQHKCTERIRDYCAEGTTLLFVSHSPGAVKALCNRAVMLAEGHVTHDGPPDEVIDHYNALIAKRTNQYHISIQKDNDGRAVTRSGTGEVTIEAADLQVKGTSLRVVRSAAGVEIIVVAKASKMVNSLCAGILIRDRWGNDVWGTNSSHHEVNITSVVPGRHIKFYFSIPNFYLAPGTYSVSAALHSGMDHVSGNYDWQDRVLTFDVVQGSGAPCVGVCNLPVSVMAELGQ